MKIWRAIAIAIFNISSHQVQSLKEILTSLVSHKNSSICNNHNLIGSNDSENSFIFEIDQGILMKEKDFNQLRKWFIAQLVEPK